MNALEEDRYYRELDKAFYAQWKLQDYTGEDCAACGRCRVCKCPNGKRRCEKCNWCPEDGEYITEPY